MEIVLSALLVPVVIGVIVWSRGVQRRARRQEGERYRAFAARHGWTYQESNPAYVDRWPGKPFTEGHRRQANQLLFGTHRGWRFVILEHRSQTGGAVRSGSGPDAGYIGQTNRRWHTVWVVTLPRPLPRLQVASWSSVRGNVTDQVASYDVPTGDVTFDERFRVQSDDDNLARTVVGPEVRHALEPGSFQELRIEGDELICVAFGRKAPEESAARLDLLVWLASRIPS